MKKGEKMSEEHKRKISATLTKRGKRSRPENAKRIKDEKPSEIDYSDPKDVLAKRSKRRMPPKKGEVAKIGYVRPPRVRDNQPIPGEETVVRLPNGRYLTNAGPQVFEEPKLKKAEVRKLAQRHSKAAIDRLVQLMYDKDVRVARAACVDILDRAHGKVGLMKEDESEATVATREAMTDMLLSLVSGRSDKAIDITPEDAEIILNESGDD